MKGAALDEALDAAGLSKSGTADENRAGAMELKWNLPGAIPPGGSGYVSFQAVVR